MRIAVAEMLYFDAVPPVVSIDEAVEIARDYSGRRPGISSTAFSTASKTP
ncbi:MAG: transcription antitermination protein NusB [Lentisphaeria bacterium]|nr:MAG: transcription antitermination protein NusB [Lentisphaeria bacterium]